MKMQKMYSLRENLLRPTKIKFCFFLRGTHLETTYSPTTSPSQILQKKKIDTEHPKTSSMQMEKINFKYKSLTKEIPHRHNKSWLHKRLFLVLKLTSKILYLIEAFC